MNLIAGVTSVVAMAKMVLNVPKFAKTHTFTKNHNLRTVLLTKQNINEKVGYFMIYDMEYII